MVQLGLLYISLCLLSLLGQQVNGEWDLDRSQSCMDLEETKSSRNPAEPSQPEDGIYDAKIKLSKQAITEIQSFLGDKDQLTPGALDQAISQILVDVRPHIEGARMWHLEDIFGLEFDTAKMIGIYILIAMASIFASSTTFRFLPFKSMLLICFLVSIIWNWFYLYKIAFAEHTNNLIKMENIYEKCSVLKKITWIDSLKEWYRSIWTLQDDPCEKYYQVFIVDSLLVVPPIKVFMYSLVQAVFQHGILAFFRQSQRETPHPVIEHPQPNPRMIEVHVYDEVSAKSALEFVQRNQANDTRADRTIIHWRREPPIVETLRSARQNGPNEVDSHQQSQQANGVETSGDNANTVQYKSSKTKFNFEASKRQP
ncbi:Chloride channel CLIC-like protein 1 [Oryzias melastigma]|uniref:Chloride channel CLIC-like protein 1 n=1 Tax=Oryzias melastigma TaxID=30732 RepID=A0A834EV04_ORYME|nr:Chloride channel CLIC-like protein 1 [Oryzias melastigma]